MPVSTATASPESDAVAGRPASDAWGTSEIERFQNRSRSPVWVIYLAIAVLALSFLTASSFEDWVCAALIEVAAFCPLFVWARRSVLGLPIMPIYALMCLAYYAMPFAGGHPATEEYDLAAKLEAAGTVAAMILVMTLIWMKLAKPAPLRLHVVKMLAPGKRTVWVLFVFLIGAVLFQSNVLLYLIDVTSGFYGVLRAVLLTLGMLSLFCLSFFFGSGYLKGVSRYLFLGLAVILLSYQMASLYLIVAAQFGFAALIGFFLGSGRVPWKLLVSVAAILTVLQAGKMDMRLKYSESDGPPPSTMELLGEWVTTGVANAIDPDHIVSNQTVPLAHRISLIQMLLRTQARAPDEVEYLYGSSYVGIPLLLVPRIIWPERPTTSELLIQLNEHYGLLDRESAEGVSIGWGLLPEAYANFGLLGCLLLGAVLGLIIGFIQRLCGRFSILSARGMIGMLVIFGLMGMEASMAQLVTTMMQSLVPVGLLASMVMQPRGVMT